MNEFENKLDAAADPTVHELREELRSLRALISTTLIVLIVFVCCLNAFLLRQASIVGNEAASAQKFVADFESFGGPWARNFWDKLKDYSKTHPDFAPIISKYNSFIVENPANTAPAGKK